MPKPLSIGLRLAGFRLRRLLDQSTRRVARRVHPRLASIIRAFSSRKFGSSASVVPPEAAPTVGVGRRSPQRKDTLPFSRRRSIPLPLLEAMFAQALVRVLPNELEKGSRYRVLYLLCVLFQGVKAHCLCVEYIGRDRSGVCACVS